MLRGFTRRFKPLEILTDEQVTAIHTATLAVLSQTGVTFQHEKALELFEKSGCKVDYEGTSVGRVHFPPALVEECLGKVPSSFLFKARDPKNNIVMGGDTLHFTAGCGMQALDLDSYEMRPATRKENYEDVLIMDALENLDWNGTYTPYFGFKGVPSAMSMLENQASRIRNSGKAVGFAFSGDSEVFSIEMAQAVGADAMGNFVAAPPLTFYRESVEACYRFIGAGFAIQVVSGPVMGGTAPATYAGATVTNNAEMIAAVVLTQLIRPGTRILATDFTFPQNMKTGLPGFGQIGCSIHQLMFNQIWRKYGVPKSQGSTGHSVSKRIDIQNGYERAILLVLHALSGANNAWFFGAVYGELTWSPIQAIIDEDIVNMVGRFMQGVEVNDETLAVDLINKVGPIPGCYLAEEHTRKWWQKEQFVARVADGLDYPSWIEMGKRSCIDYAKERREKILATHKMSLPLTSTQEEDIERILNEARQFYRKKGIISDEEWETYMKDLKSPNYPYA